MLHIDKSCKRNVKIKSVLWPRGGLFFFLKKKMYLMFLSYVPQQKTLPSCKEIHNVKYKSPSHHRLTQDAAAGVPGSIAV